MWINIWDTLFDHLRGEDSTCMRDGALHLSKSKGILVQPCQTSRCFGVLMLDIAGHPIGLALPPSLVHWPNLAAYPQATSLAPSPPVHYHATTGSPSSPVHRHHSPSIPFYPDSPAPFTGGRWAGEERGCQATKMEPRLVDRRQPKVLGPVPTHNNKKGFQVSNVKCPTPTWTTWHKDNIWANLDSKEMLKQLL